MKIERCEKGHFYDSDSFSRCPHCEKENSRAKNTGEASSSVRRAEKGKNVCGGAGARRTMVKKNADPPEYELETVLLSAGRGSESLQVPAVSPVSAVKRISSAESCVNDAETGEPEGNQSGAEDDGSAATSVRNDDAIPETAANPELQIDDKNEEPPRTEGDSTEAACSWEQTETLGVFTAFTEGSGRKDPPAGWFVCVSGPGWGEIYPVKSGGNTIGRSQTNDIVLEGDDRVSREKHARVVYEPRNRVFYIEAGERSGLTYLNGENILHHATLSAYDRIEIGGGTYLFIPLCGEAFGWEEYPFRKDDA